jgi:hypothetical protein
MPYTYEVKEEQKVVIRISDNGEVSSIPMTEANSDYQRYLRWLENSDADEAQSL